MAVENSRKMRYLFPQQSQVSCCTVSKYYETIVDKAKAVAQLIIWNDTLVSAQINATYSMLCSP